MDDIPTTGEKIALISILSFSFFTITVLTCFYFWRYQFTQRESVAAPLQTIRNLWYPAPVDTHPRWPPPKECQKNTNSGIEQV